MTKTHAVILTLMLFGVMLAVGCNNNNTNDDRGDKAEHEAETPDNNKQAVDPLKQLKELSTDFCDDDKMMDLMLSGAEKAMYLTLNPEILPDGITLEESIEKQLNMVKGFFIMMTSDLTEEEKGFAICEINSVDLTECPDVYETMADDSNYSVDAEFVTAKAKEMKVEMCGKINMKSLQNASKMNENPEENISDVLLVHIDGQWYPVGGMN